MWTDLYQLKQYTVISSYVLHVVGNTESDDSEVVDPGEILKQAQGWKVDILDNCLCSPQDLPMMVLVNNKQGVNEHDSDENRVTNRAELVELAIKNGFASW